MKVLLTGASGFIGRNLGQALAAAGHGVVPVSRRHSLDMAQMLSKADWLPHLDGIDAVVNTVGIIGQTRTQRFETLHTRAPVALFEACADRGIGRVVQVSALGADETAFSAYHLSKRAADEALLRLVPGGTVLRPSLIYGQGGTSATMFLRLSRLPWVPVLGDGGQTLQPVHISDVVAAILQALQSPPEPRSIDLVGPQTLDFAQWMQTLRAAQGLSPARLLRIPPSLALLGSRIASALHPLAHPDNVRMLLTSRAADGQAAERLLGRPLLRPEPHLQFEDASVLWRRA